MVAECFWLRHRMQVMISPSNYLKKCAKQRHLSLPRTVKNKRLKLWWTHREIGLWLDYDWIMIGLWTSRGFQELLLLQKDTFEPAPRLQRRASKLFSASQKRQGSTKNISNWMQMLATFVGDVGDVGYRKEVNQCHNFWTTVRYYRTHLFPYLLLISLICIIYVCVLRICGYLWIWYI